MKATTSSALTSRVIDVARVELILAPPSSSRQEDVAWHQAPRALRGLAEVDAVFTIVVASFALADPTGAVAWLRVVLAGLAIGVAAVAAVKLLVAARLEPGRAAAPRG